MDSVGSVGRPARASTHYRLVNTEAEALSWTADPLAARGQRRIPSWTRLPWPAWPRSRGLAQAALAWAEAQALRLSGDRVQVQIVTDAAGLPGAIAAMTKAGGEVTVRLATTQR
jgi:hypothetical protein